ncbi:MAG: hypothetical protein FIA95_04490 [Gemmatimonadetes bacterium]|nr:hypothetical protein [Gemmatimonadota bacterium]
MRTTLTLDPDVAAALERWREARDLSLKVAVNEAIRHGLKALEGPRAAERPPYRIRPWSAGRVLTGSVDDVAEVLAAAEGEAFRGSSSAPCPAPVPGSRSRNMG